MAGRKGRCDNCDTKFLIEETIIEPLPAAAPAPDWKPSRTPIKKNSNTPLVLLCLVLVLGAGGYWAFTPMQEPGEPSRVAKNAPSDLAENPTTSAKPAPPVSEKAAVEEIAPLDSAPDEGEGEGDLVKNASAEKTIEKIEEPEERPNAQETAEATPIKEAPVAVIPAEVAPVVPSLQESFPVRTEFSHVDIREYQDTYPDVFQGWMPNEVSQADEAKAWGSYLGPLGIRVRSHASQLQGRAAFAAIVPVAIQTAEGELGIPAAEVVQIAPGSPSENHLQLGDLIIGIEGEMLKSGNQYRPDWKFMHKDARELQLMLGEKIDQGQARGDIRLTVLRFPEGASEHLPVFKKELWSGTGGSESVGLQKFDIEVPAGGYITLETNQFDGNIHGDGAVWLDVTLEGDYGRKKLLEMAPDSAHAGYGRPEFITDKTFSHKGKTYQQALNLHANGEAKWLLPEGTKRIKGSFAALSYGQVQPKVHYTNEALPLSGTHKEHIVELRFPIGKTGSFSNTYPKNCPKTEQMVSRHTEWLAAQQREDGSWPRLRGYTRDGWDTSWCALALMSSGDSKYDEQVKKAAYRIAYADAPSEWTAERAMRLIFLSEYYLRTKDEKIVAGIQAAYYQLLDCAKTDYMAGHKVNGFGYGIAGQHYGTGHLALGLALASRTPITTSKGLVSNIIRHAGEVLVNGTYAYGRGRRMARDYSREHSGGNAMSGSGMLGVQIGGGHLSAVKEHIERIDASIGDGDNSHATSSLAFIFSSLAIATSDESVFLKHMQNFRYKMTIDDNWDGGFLKSAFPLDLASGEGVTSNTIRTAGYILVLNGLKKNLAITGKTEHWNKNYIPTVAVSEWGGQVHSYYLRNWALAKEILGNRAPKELDQGIRAMYSLPRTLELVPKSREIVLRSAPTIIQRINSLGNLSKTDRAYAIELVSGLDFKIYTEKKGNEQEIKLHINQPLHQLNWLDEDKEEMFKRSPFPLRAKVEITADNIADIVSFETDGTKDFNLDEGTRNFSVTKPLKDSAIEEFEGVAKITFKIGNTAVSYDRPLKFNTEFAHSNHYNLRRLQLKLRRAPRAYFQSQPLMIAGIPFDCMYPKEMMLEVQGPADGSAVNLHEGDEVLVDLASENFICAWVHSIEYETPTQVSIIKAQSQKSIIGKLNGNKNHLYDFDLSTSCELVSANSKSVIEYDFGRDVTLNGLDAAFGGNCFIRVWYRDRDAWVPLVWDNYSVNTGHHPVFPDTSARVWRLEIQHGGNMQFQTLRFYHNPNMQLKHARLPQMDSAKFIPAIEPQ